MPAESAEYSDELNHSFSSLKFSYADANKHLINVICG